MAALVQSYPQSSSTVTMLQPRPSSSSAAFQTSSQGQQRGSGGARNGYPGSTMASYAATVSSTPVAPYAFTSTPALVNNQGSTGPYLRQEHRTLSAPASAVNLPNQPSTRPKQSLPPTLNDIAVDASTGLNIASQPLDLTLSDPRIATGNAPKPSPDRYRRAHRRSETSSAALGGPALGGSAMPSGSGMATVGHLYNFPTQSVSSPSFTSSVNAALASKDDTALGRQNEQAKRYRRRSMATMSNEEPPQSEPRQQVSAPVRSYASVLSTPYTPQKIESTTVNAIPRPDFSRGRTNSDQSSASSKSSRPSSVSKSLSVAVSSAALNSRVLVEARGQHPRWTLQPHGYPRCSSSEKRSQSCQHPTKRGL